VKGKRWAALAVFAMVVALLPLSAVPAVGATGDLFFSEYIEGSSNNKALEIYNGTGATVDLAAGLYSIEIYFNGSTSAGTTINLTGTVADGGVYVVADDGADAAIVADQTSTSNFFNGDDAVVLRKNGAIVDSIGQVGFDPGSYWGSGDTTTQNHTLVRKSTVCAGDSDDSDAFDPSVEWDGFAQDTFTYLGSHTASCGAVETMDPVINEFVFNHTGLDTNEYVEVFGTPDTDYSSYWIVEIEGDSGSSLGKVDDGTMSVGTTDASGFWTTGFQDNLWENGTVTLLLVEGFTGAVNDDLDTNDDGVLDVTPWTRVVDAIAVSDGDTGDQTYSDVVLTASFDGGTFTVGGASRIPNGIDTDSTTDWMRNDFDLYGIPGYAGSPEVGEAVNTPGAINAAITQEEADFGVCGDDFTAIYDIQGSGSASPLDGETVVSEGVVVGDFQEGLSGFFMQDPVGDSDAATSDGIFVYYPSYKGDVALGDQVRVMARVDEYYDLTELTSVVALEVCSTDNSVPSPTPLSLPVTAVDDFEAYEGMLVTFPQALVISEYYAFAQYGEIVLTGHRHLTPTAEFEPGSPEEVQAVQDYLLDKITLDDGRSAQNPDPAIHPDGAVFDLNNLFRGGDTVANVTGVMDYQYSLYRIQPTQGADYTNANPRPAQPDAVGGNLKVSNFNVLNYFTTIDENGNLCGPDLDQECRGADTTEEFNRQRAKIIAALAAINADVVGLTEIENYPGDVPTADLVAGLNDVLGDGTYAYVETGAIGTDAIRVALIYKPATVSPVGAYAVLDSTVDPRFIDTKSRPALAQTFEESETGEAFTVVVNHLKSKGSACDDVGDPDLGDGAGNCNLTRKAAAEALADWLLTDPTGSGDPDFLIIGDLNSYDKEDPIDALKAGGFQDLVYGYQGEDAYSYVFDGQTGYLDYQLANPSLAVQVTGATVWHINADEPSLIDYDMTYKKAAQDAIYAPDPYRSSDHDPVIVGLSLTPPSVAQLEAIVRLYADIGAITGNNTEKILLDRLKRARDYLAKGKMAAYVAQLRSFINQVQGFAPMFIDQDVADILSNYAELLMSQ